MPETQLDRIEQSLAALDRRIDLFAVAVFERFDRLEQRMDAVEQRMDAVEHRLGAVEQRVDSLWSEFQLFREETRARFESIERRIGLLEKTTSEMLLTLASVQKDMIGLRTQLELLSVQTGQQISQLSDDMQQRFRLVNDRLHEVEKRLAA